VIISGVNTILARYRPSEWTLITVMTAITVFMAGVGIYALWSAPALLIDSEVVSVREGIRITHIVDVTVTQTDMWKLPAFRSSAEEQIWWKSQDRIHEALSSNRSAVIEFVDNTDTHWEVLADIGQMPFSEIMERLGIVYIVAAIYIFASISVFRHHRRTTGFLCAIFLSTTALYLVSVAPVVHRPLVMDPELLRLLVSVFFIASTGQISIVHFSTVFPEPKQLLGRFPWLPVVFYGYSVFISALYLSGTIALVTTLPFLVLWILLMAGSFAHSMLRIDDAFMKKQVNILFIAVVLVSAFFMISIVVPWPEGGSLINNYALFSLILPFALILTLDNQRLYRDRLALEYNARVEKERLHRELHDTVLNDLASISIAVEGTERSLNDPDKVRKKLQQIRNNTEESSRQLRNFLWVIDDRQSTWEDVANSLRRLGYDLLGHVDIAFDLDAEIGNKEAPAPTPAIKHAIYRVFREALINIAKHAHAHRVHSSLALTDSGLEIAISDDGVGIDPALASDEGHGLNNMRRRLREQGGDLQIMSQPGAGTRVLMQLTLNPASLPK
jgi:signal transduction histidine kinase